jgi:hypothetical protein
MASQDGRRNTNSDELNEVASSWDESVLPTDLKNWSQSDVQLFKEYWSLLRRKCGETSLDALVESVKRVKNLGLKVEFRKEMSESQRFELLGYALKCCLGTCLLGQGCCTASRYAENLTFHTPRGSIDTFLSNLPGANNLVGGEVTGKMRAESFTSFIAHQHKKRKVRTELFFSSIK